MLFTSWSHVWCSAVELLPAEQRRLLKWKMSSVTPNIVKHTIARSHFKATKSESSHTKTCTPFRQWDGNLFSHPEWVNCVVNVESNNWLGCWGHHMKSPGFKAIGEHQKASICTHTLLPMYLQSPDWTCGCSFLFFAVEPLSRNLSDWQEGPTLEESVQDAASLWQAGV